MKDFISATAVQTTRICYTNLIKTVTQRLIRELVANCTAESQNQSAAIYQSRHTSQILCIMLSSIVTACSHDLLVALGVWVTLLP